MQSQYNLHNLHTLSKERHPVVPKLIPAPCTVPGGWINTLETNDQKTICTHS